MREKIKTVLVEYGLSVVKATNDHTIYASQPRSDVLAELEKLADVKLDAVLAVVEEFTGAGQVVIPDAGQTATQQKHEAEQRGRMKR